MPNEAAVLDHTGHSKFMWDAANEAEVEGARAQFNALKKKGYIAYRVDKKGESTGEIVREFDPEIEKLIMSPPMRGG